MVPTEPPSLSLQSPSSLKNRLLIPHNPNTSLSPHPNNKKTRHLPNLSDCHSCRRHVTNPAAPLQTLDSLWRIVLLCNQCLLRLRSADSCSYCFSPAAPADSHRCSACRRRVHRYCAARYRSSPPWSFCNELGFTVCIDCWVPKSLDLPNRVLRNRRKEGEIRVSSDGRREKKRNVGSKSIVLSDKVCENGKSLEFSSKGEVRRVSSDNQRDRKKNVGLKSVVLSEKVFENGKSLNSSSEGEIRVSGNGEREKRKNVGMKRGLEFVNNEGSMRENDGFDDAELAKRLHREMNSSPRILRKFSLGRSKGLGGSSVRMDGGDLLVRCLEPKGRFSFTYKRRGCDSKLSDDSVCSNFSEQGNSKHDFLVYKRKCKSCDEFRVKEEVVLENNCMVLENQICQTQDMLVYRRKGRKCDEWKIKDEVMPENNTQDVLVYRRKCRKCDKCKVIEEVISENGMILENRKFQTQDVLVYRRKCKKEDECQENGEGVPENNMYLENCSLQTGDELKNKLCVGGGTSISFREEMNLVKK